MSENNLSKNSMNVHEGRIKSNYKNKRRKERVLFITLTIITVSTLMFVFFFQKLALMLSFAMVLPSVLLLLAGSIVLSIYCFSQRENIVQRKGLLFGWAICIICVSVSLVLFICITLKPFWYFFAWQRRAPVAAAHE